MVSCSTHLIGNTADHDPLDRTIHSYGIKNVSDVRLFELRDLDCADANYHRTVLFILS